MKRKNLIDIIKTRSGFTVWEVLSAIIILVLIILIAANIYVNYIDKARITIAENVLNHARDNLSLYCIDNNKFPVIINFSNCIDENGHAVFSESLCDQLKTDLYSIESYIYNIEDGKYVLIARANDKKHTPLKVTPEKVTE